MNTTISMCIITGMLVLNGQKESIECIIEAMGQQTSGGLLKSQVIYCMFLI